MKAAILEESREHVLPLAFGSLMIPWYLPHRYPLNDQPD